ncbi:hypothetical protein T4D_12544 [Trichinella pseudospiralis]|uniref:Uncharacterized protein n=1 Tax=Trichinella pseudospiralis TaxID=6337 RepID=A0A0V1FBP0_TRIPS|nr:hypothetical protein T4D_12544 [Trichinella pseudospiralis]
MLMTEDLKIFTSICDGMQCEGIKELDAGKECWYFNSSSFANVKVKWIFVLKTNDGILILNGMSTVVRSDDTEVLLCIICSSPLYGFYIVSDERLKSTVGCSDNISSLFMVALGAGTTQVQIIALKYLDIPQMRNTFSVKCSLFSIFWFRRTYKQLMQWFLMCLKIHGLYSGVVLWYFGVYYAATLPDQASWTGSRGVLLCNMYLSSMNPVSKLLLRKRHNLGLALRLPQATPSGVA